jgi:hypothetical protein
MNWKHAIPVVSLVQAPRVKQALVLVFEVLEEHLTVPKSFKPVPLVIVDDGFLEVNAEGEFYPDTRHIRISNHAKYPILTSLHEIVHALDFQSDYIVSSRQIEFQNAILQSSATLRLKQQIDIDSKQFQTEEFFARCFEQWISFRSTQKALRLEWKEQSQEAFSGLYWSSQEFAILAPVFEKALRATKISIKRHRFNQDLMYTKPQGGRYGKSKK